MEIDLNGNNFESEVIKSDLPVLVDFWATWCGPCKMTLPHVEAAARKYEGKLKVGKVNVDESSDLAMAFGVSSIPTLLLFKGGEVVNQHVGAMNPAQLEAFIASAL